MLFVARATDDVAEFAQQDPRAIRSEHQQQCDYTLLSSAWATKR